MIAVGIWWSAHDHIRAGMLNLTTSVEISYNFNMPALMWSRAL